jgi:N-acetylmuramoyl-L-alanine amidase
MGAMIRAVVLWLALALALPGAGQGQDLSALARFEAAASSVTAQGAGAEVRLSISQPVPWRVRVMDAPPRLILDVREVDWTGAGALPLSGTPVTGLRAGVFRTGWSRLVLDLGAPLLPAVAEMVTGPDGATIRLKLAPADPAAFAAAAARPEPPDWALPAAADLAPPPARGAGPITIVLDPGHGGIDPGAERDGYTEAALMLTFAREFKELLVRDGRFRVVLTREDDVFVPLEARTSIARAAGAHLFLSLHADALAEGEATGATVYTLAEEATDAAAAALAERHDRDDLLAGVDLTGHDDLVAAVLMDMARTETQPRIERLAAALVAAMKDAEIRTHRKPHQRAGFSVLKSPDIPAALIELGFLSSARDLARLTDPDWRARMAEALLAGIAAWAAEDAALRALAPG